jgi:hypothetical protein
LNCNGVGHVLRLVCNHYKHGQRQKPPNCRH